MSNLCLKEFLIDLEFFKEKKFKILLYQNIDLNLILGKIKILFYIMRGFKFF